MLFEDVFIAFILGLLRQSLMLLPIASNITYSFYLLSSEICNVFLAIFTDFIPGIPHIAASLMIFYK
jgi:hypothetical protein